MSGLIKDYVHLTGSLMTRRFSHAERHVMAVYLLQNEMFPITRWARLKAWFGFTIEKEHQLACAYMDFIANDKERE